MADSGQVYKGYFIWRDAFRWIVRTTSRGDQAGEQTARFGTLAAAKAYIDRNPR